MRGQGKADGEFSCFFVEFPRPPVRRVTPDSKLGPDEESIRLRAWDAEKLFVETIKLQFLSCGVLAPRDKEASPARVVRVGEKAEPMKIPDRLAAIGISP